MCWRCITLTTVMKSKNKLCRWNKKKTHTHQAVCRVFTGLCGLYQSVKHCKATNLCPTTRPLSWLNLLRAWPHERQEKVGKTSESEPTSCSKEQRQSFGIWQKPNSVNECFGSLATSFVVFLKSAVDSSVWWPCFHFDLLSYNQYQLSTTGAF